MPQACREGAGGRPAEAARRDERRMPSVFVLAVSAAWAGENVEGFERESTSAGFARCLSETASLTVRHRLRG